MNVVRISIFTVEARCVKRGYVCGIRSQSSGATVCFDSNVALKRGSRFRRLRISRGSMARGRSSESPSFARLVRSWSRFRKSLVQLLDFVTIINKPFCRLTDDSSFTMKRRLEKWDPFIKQWSRYSNACEAGSMTIAGYFSWRTGIDFDFWIRIVIDPP